MIYAEIFQETMTRWQGGGGITAATAYVEEQLSKATTPEDRGRLLSLKAGCYKRQNDSQTAEEALAEALELVADPAARVDVLCECLELCVDEHRVEDGQEYARQMAALFDGCSDENVMSFRAPYHHNLGRLYTKAGDYRAAAIHLAAAHKEFAATDRVREALMSNVSLAAVYQASGKLREAEGICRNVLMDESASAYILAKANLLLGEIIADLGDDEEAERYLDRASESHAAVVGKRDYRIFLDILNAEAHLAERRGDVITARRLRAHVRRKAAVCRINLGEVSE